MNQPTEHSVFTSAARTATSSSEDFINYGRGLVLVLSVTAVTATPSVVFTVEGKVNGLYYTILTSAAITATGTTVWKIYPGLTAAANTVVSDVVPMFWRVTATHGDADSITFSLSASVIP